MRFGVRELAFVVLLLGLLVAAWFLFSERNQRRAEARLELQQDSAKLAQLDAALANMPDLGAEIHKLSQAIDLFEQKLPAQQEVEGILQDVWTLAKNRKLDPKSVRTDKIITTANYAELPIKMVIIGDFDGFYSFLLDLEQLPRITRMPRMKLTKFSTNQSEVREGMMQADVTLSIFFEGESTTKARTPQLGGGRS